MMASELFTMNFELPELLPFNSLMFVCFRFLDFEKIKNSTILSLAYIYKKIGAKLLQNCQKLIKK